MKRTVLSWVSTLMLVLLGFVQVAHAQRLNEKKSDSNNAFDIYFVGTDTTASGPGGLKQGFISLKFKIDALKNENIENVYFRLPENGSVISPVGFYTSTNGKGNNGNGQGNVSKRYRVLATKHLLPNTFTAEHAVKFEAIGGKKAKSNKKVKTEEFEILLSEAEYATMTTMHIAVESSEEGLNNQTDVKRIGYTHFDLFEKGVRINRQVDTGNGSKLNTANRKTITPLATCTTPLPTLSGETDPCPGDVETYAIEENVRYQNIKWVVPTGWVIQRVYGRFNHILEVKVGEVSGSIMASVDVYNCGTQVVSMPTYMGDKIPVELTVVNGDKDGTDDEEFKKGDFLIFEAKAVPSAEKKDYKYTWSYPSDWKVFSGQGSSVLIIEAGSEAGFVEVNVSSISERTPRYCGLGYDYVELVPFEEEDPCDGPTIEVDTPKEVCPGVEYRLSVKNPDPNQKIKYQFFVPDGVTIVSQGYGYAIVKVLEVSRGTTELAFTVVAVNADNCGASDVCVKIPVGDCPDVCPLPAIPTLSIPSPLCNIRNFTFSHAVQEGVTYEYLFPDGFLVEDLGNGQLSVDIVLEGEMLDVTQTLTVIATNACGESTTYETTVTVGECNNGEPLPVTLTRFDGASRNGSVELAWSTASEINNDRFEIERSANGKEFKKVGEVKGNGNSTALIDYAYTDRSAASGTVYYRLKQVDFDGKSEYSKVIAVSHTGSASSTAMSVYPNPVTDGKVSLRFQQQVDGNATIRLTDMSGRVLYSQEAANVSAEHDLNLTGLNLKAGIYMISVTANGQSSTQRIMVR